MSNEKVVLDLVVYFETDAAYLMGEPGGDREDAVWVPKSQLDDWYVADGSEQEVEMPEWLAIEKEFV